MFFPVQGNVSVISWDCVTWHGVGTVCKVNINAVKYRETLENNLWPVFTVTFITYLTGFSMPMLLYIALALSNNIKGIII